MFAERKIEAQREEKVMACPIPLIQALDKVAKVLADLNKVLKECAKVEENCKEKMANGEVSEHFRKSLHTYTEVMKTAQATAVQSLAFLRFVAESGLETLWGKQLNYPCKPSHTLNSVASALV